MLSNKAFPGRGFLSGLAVLLVVSACQAPVPVANRAPMITALAANPTTVEIGATSGLTASATDADGDGLSYAWSSSSGTFNTSVGSNVTWTAPASPGSVTITLAVNDGTNAPVKQSLTVMVVNSAPAVTNFTAQVSGSTVTLAWTNPVSANFSQVVVRRGATAFPQTPTDGTEIYVGTNQTVSDGGLTGGTDYYYSIWARNTQGAYSAPATAKATTAAVATVPSAPTSLVATAVSSTEIQLSWQTGSANTTQFVVERATAASGPWATATTVGSGVLTFTDSGLPPSTMYYYRVKGTNVTGSSPYSNTATASSQASALAPAAPSSLVQSAITVSSVTLGWSDNATTEQGYRVYRTVNGGTGATLGPDLAANTKTYTDSTLAAGILYTYYIRAFNNVGESAASNILTVDTQLPGVPANLQATGATNSVSLVWTDSLGETSYQLERGTAAAGPFTTVSASIAANGSSYQDTTVTTGQTYYYRLKAVNLFGASSYSSVVSAKTGLVTGVWGTSTWDNAVWAP